VTRYVEPFDLTLLLPLRLAVRGKGAPLQDRVREALVQSKMWEAVDPLRRGTPEGHREDGFVYAELAYFHPHLRDFLYGRRQQGEGEQTRGPVTLYRQTLLSGEGFLRAEGPDLQVSFHVDAVLLYLVEPETAILAVQMRATRPLQWGECLNVISYLRFVYYQDYRPGAKKDGTCIWIGGNSQILETISVLPPAPEERRAVDRTAELRGSIRERTPAILPHWEQLLAPLRTGEIAIHPLGDHRMAAMAFMGLETPDALIAISDDEWFALAQADSAGFAQYAPDFVRSELVEACYDRWWDPSVSGSDLKQRYLTGPLTFLSVLQWPAENRPGHLDRMRITWSHQQFEIFLLAHYQRAALLILEGRIRVLSEETKAKSRGREQRKWEDEVERLQGDLVRFSSGHWFVEITPQIQGQELYSRLKKHLCLDALYASVVRDKSLLTNWIDQRAAKNRQEFWDLVNNWYLPLALALALLGNSTLTGPVVTGVRNWLCSTQALSELSDRSPEITTAASVVIAVCAISCLVWRALFGRMK
jgi:hypothetical protein